jgi:hypothetical protein
MALDNALVYRPFGAALVQVGTGTANALETLGYTQSGVTIAERYATKPIMTDVMGPEMGSEEQKFGIEATAEIPLAVWNPTIWDKVIKRMSNGTTSGVLGPSGTLMFTNSWTVRLALVSADSLEDPFYYPATILHEPTSRKKGSVAEPLVVRMRARPYHLATTTTASGIVLWSRTLPP